MIYEITPYVSANMFAFGKKQSEIKKLCGAPFTTKIDNIHGIVIESREGCELVYEEKKLAYVTLNKHVTPIVRGVEIFSEGAIDRLKGLDQDFLEGPQYVVFTSLGICVGDLGKKKIPEGKIVNVFAKEKLVFFEFFVTD
jgi:hypothetical protein